MSTNLNYTLILYVVFISQKSKIYFIRSQTSQKTFKIKDLNLFPEVLFSTKVIITIFLILASRQFFSLNCT